MRIGWVNLRDGRLVAHGHAPYPHPGYRSSSSSAEYLAMIEGAMKALRDMGVKCGLIEVIVNQRWMIEQISRGWLG